jgi:phage repressor protein C with HTH and peptisase S24 domain
MTALLPQLFLLVERKSGFYVGKMSDDPREALRTLMAASPGETLAALSKMLGKNTAYLHQYLTRGSPRRLRDRERIALARYFGVSEAVLGGPDARPAPVRVPRRDALLSAGPGALDNREEEEGALDFTARTLRQLGARGPLSLVRAQGTSMMPGIADGDELLVDEGDRRAVAKPGVFAIRIDGAAMVKRVSRMRGQWIIKSDNPDAPRVPKGEVEVIGRVLWLGRPLV